ncbi:MAG: DUF4864 domain-containing protein [Patescibacteria group bacterium]
MENTTIPKEGKPKKKMQLWKKILIGIGIFIVLIIYWAFQATSGIVKVSEKQLNLIASGDFKGAYNLTSNEFQRSVSYDKFVNYVNNYEVLKNYKSHTFTSREIKGETGTITGTLSAKDGTVTPVKYQFIKENKEWKILSVDLSSSDSGISSSLENKSASVNSSDMNTFSDATLGYSIQYPKDWTYEKPDNVTVVFRGPKEKNMSDVTVNVQNLASVNRGGKYTDSGDVVKDLKKQVQSMDKSAVIGDSQDINLKRADGLELIAKSFAMAFTYQGQKYKQLQIVVPHGDSLTFHAWAYRAPFDNFDKYSDVIKTIADSWTINK